MLEDLDEEGSEEPSLVDLDEGELIWEICLEGCLVEISVDVVVELHQDEMMCRLLLH